MPPEMRDARVQQDPSEALSRMVSSFRDVCAFTRTTTIGDQPPSTHKELMLVSPAAEGRDIPSLVSREEVDFHGAPVVKVDEFAGFGDALLVQVGQFSGLGRRVHSGMGKVRHSFGRYALRCVVFHIGEGPFGHYVASVHTPRGWVRCDDSSKSDPFPGSKPDYPHHNPSLLLYVREDLWAPLARIRTFTNLGQTCWCNSLSQMIMCLLQHRSHICA